MPLPNLLATRRGRLAAFFFLYLTEGIPLGFAAVAIAAQLRRQGVGPAAIGAFVGSLYLPWAFKWVFGPIVDVFASERFGRRRGWILLTQSVMVATLLSAAFVRLPEQLWLFTAIVFVHNLFGATQDVAIDALACGVLADDERGAANGLMFAGAYLGQAVGGSLVLFLADHIPFQSTFVFVAASILAVTVGVVLPMREPPGPPRPEAGRGWRAAVTEMRQFAALSFRSILGSRGAFAGLFFALLPTGAMSLGLALGSNLGVELGLTDSQIASLSLASTVVAASCCVAGGFLSDRVGRRRLMLVGVPLLALPVLATAAALLRAGWIMPVDVSDPGRPQAPTFLIATFVAATLVYYAINGSFYGVRSALFMDVTNPVVAGTQFTAYMALMNVTIAFSATWQGLAIERWGYPGTMLADVIVGMLCLALIPLIRRPAAALGLTDGATPIRARALAAGLAGLLLVSLLWGGADPAEHPIASTLFTLLFVGSAVFLGAGGATLRRSAPVLARAGLAVAPFLLLVAARRLAAPALEWLLARLAELFGPGTHPEATVRWLSGEMPLIWQCASLASPAIAAVILLLLATRPWTELRSSELPAEA